MREWTKEEEDAWGQWVAGRPPAIQELCKKFPPNTLYKMAGTGNICTLHSYNENGTVTVNVTGEHNLVMFDRRVFGINPEDLTPCDPPKDDDPTGTLLTESDDIDAFILDMKTNDNQQSKT